MEEGKPVADCKPPPLPPPDWEDVVFSAVERRTFPVKGLRIWIVPWEGWVEVEGVGVEVRRI